MFLMRAVVPLLFVSLGFAGCVSETNLCNKGGPQSLTLGTYDGVTFTPFEADAVHYVKWLSSGGGGSGQGGFSRRFVGLDLVWLVTGVSRKAKSIEVTVTLPDESPRESTGRRYPHDCEEGLGLIGRMNVPIETERDQIDLIGLGVTVEIEGQWKWKDTTLTDTSEGSLDLAFTPSEDTGI